MGRFGREDQEPGESVRDNAQEVGGKGGDQEVICMNRSPSKGKGALQTGRQHREARGRPQRRALQRKSVLIL